MVPRDPPVRRAGTLRTGAREAAASRHPRTAWPHTAEPAACPGGLDPRTAIANRRSVMLATLRSEAPVSLAQQIFDETAIAIVEGRLRPGQSLNSVELAKRFATSRTPVREALAELERQGAVIVAPHQRPRVAQADLCSPDAREWSGEGRGHLTHVISHFSSAFCACSRFSA